MCWDKCDKHDHYQIATHHARLRKYHHRSKNDLSNTSYDIDPVDIADIRWCDPVVELRMPEVIDPCGKVSEYKKVECCLFHVMKLIQSPQTPKGGLKTKYPKATCICIKPPLRGGLVGPFLKQMLHQLLHLADAHYFNNILSAVYSLLIVVRNEYFVKAQFVCFGDALLYTVDSTYLTA